MPICCKCGKILSSEQSLKYHMVKKIKCDSNDLKCKICNVRFSSKFDLKIHMKEHENLKNHQESLVKGFSIGGVAY